MRFVLSFGIEGMFCTNCSSTINESLKNLPGVENVDVLLSTNSAKVVYDDKEVSLDAILEAVEVIGFDTSIISNDAADERRVNDKESTVIMRVLVCSIDGMFCPNCSEVIENAINAKDGVIKIEVSLATNSARIEYDANVISSKEDIMESIEVIGYDVELSSDEEVITTEISVDNDLSKKKVLLVAIEADNSSQIDINLVIEDLQAIDGVISVDMVGKRSKGSGESSASTGRSRFVDGYNACIRWLDGGDFFTSTSTELVGTLRVLFWQDKSMVGARALVMKASKRHPSASISISSQGSFQQAARNARIAEERQRSMIRNLAIAVVLTVPLLIVTYIKLVPALRNSTLNAEAIHGVSNANFASFLLSTPVQFISGRTFHIKAISVFYTGEMGMDLMVTTGTFLAYLYSVAVFLRAVAGGLPTDSYYFDTSAVLITVILLGKYLQVYAKGYTTASISNLMTLRAATARLVSIAEGSAWSDSFNILSGDGAGAGADAGTRNPLMKDPTVSHDYVAGSRVGSSSGSGNDVEIEMRPSRGAPAGADAGMYERKDSEKAQEGELGEGGTGGEDVKIDVSLLQMGDILRLVAGETIPADCDIVSGSIGVNESMLTGESAMVHKSDEGGSRKVYSGTIVIEGSATARVMTYGDDSVLGQIVSTVQTTQESKPDIQALADTAARRFVPLISAISVITFVAWAVAGQLDMPRSWWAGRGYESPTVMALMFALSVWVSACPCAFGLATPTAILVATGVSARYGVLIRKGSAIQNGSHITAVAFDKTGTLTMGEMEVTEMVEFDGRGGGVVQSLARSQDDLKRGTLSPVTESIHAWRDSQSSIRCIGGNGAEKEKEEEKEEEIRPSRASRASSAHLAGHPASPLIPMTEVLALLYEAERRSGHPLAKAISSFCLERLDGAGGGAKGGEYSITLEPGKGLRLYKTSQPASSDEPVLLVGSSSFMAMSGVATREATDIVHSMRASGRVAIHVAAQGKLRAVVAVSDGLHPEAAEVIRVLHSRGVKTYMLTGDEPLTAFAVGATVGISKDHILASCKPQDKESFIRVLRERGERVAFVGDGTNDANALAMAEVGVALGGGTDIAIDTGDIVLVKNDLSALLVGLDICNKTYWRILFNFFWSAFYNCCLIPVAAGVFYPTYRFQLQPMLAGSAMALSSITIVCSSALLSLYQVPKAFRKAQELYDSGKVVSIQKIDSARQSMIQAGAAQARASYQLSQGRAAANNGYQDQRLSKLSQASGAGLRDSVASITDDGKFTPAAKAAAQKAILDLSMF
jgi:copper ion binding protein